MRKRMGLATRRELVHAVSERYTASTQLDRVRILDEFVEATGYHRKHAIRVLAGKPRSRSALEPRLRLYDAAVREALIVLWEASDRVCGKRLKPLIPILLDAMARHGHLHPEGEVRQRLLAISAATIDRLLAPTRAAVRGRVRRPATPSVRRAAAVRTFNDWKDPPPGFTEADLVAHCGGSLAGSFVHTLTVTDIASGWTAWTAWTAWQTGQCGSQRAMARAKARRIVIRESWKCRSGREADRTGVLGGKSRGGKPLARSAARKAKRFRAGCRSTPRK